MNSIFTSLVAILFMALNFSQQQITDYEMNEKLIYSYWPKSRWFTSSAHTKLKKMNKCFKLKVRMRPSKCSKGLHLIVGSTHSTAQE